MASPYTETVVTVSAIIPATNDPDTLDRCLAALQAGGCPPDETVVVREPAWANAASARNLGAARATGDVLLFVDADVEVHEDVLERIRASFSTNGRLAALFGSYDDEPAAPGAVSAFRNLLHHHVHQSSPGRATTFWTGLGAVRRATFLAVDGFDESVEFMEDVDLGMRLSERGELIVLDPTIQGKHLKRWTLRSMVHTDFWARGVPWTALLLRHGGSRSSLNLSWRHRLSALVSIAGAVAVVRRSLLGVSGCAVALVGLNLRFYLLLVRTRGVAEAATGVALHALHHLVAAAAVPMGVLRHVRDRASS